MVDSKLLLIIVLMLQFSQCIGQSLFNPDFRQIQTESGHINHIQRDSEGYLWVSTQDGLLQFNGSSWLQFNHSRKDSLSISDNYVWLSFEDTNQNLWVGTFEGNLNKFNKETRTFTTFKNRHCSNGIRSIYQYSKDYLLIGSDCRMFRFNLKTEQYEYDASFTQRQLELGIFHITYIEQITEGQLLVSGQNGTFQLSLKDFSLKPIQSFPKSIGKIGAIKKMGDKFIMAGKNGIYLTHYNDNSNQFEIEKFFFFEGNNSISTFLEIKENLVLIGSNEGLHLLYLAKEEIVSLSNSKMQSNNGLMDKVVYCAAEIEDNLFWVGTKTSVYEFSTVPKRFNHIEQDKLCNTGVLGLTEKDENLWIGTRNGLARIKYFNQSANHWEYFCYNKENVADFRNNYIINAMVIKNQLWLGYRENGLGRFKVNQKDELELLSIPKELDELTARYSVSYMEEDSNGDVWIATSGNGVIKWLYDKNEFEHIKKGNGEDYTLNDGYIFDFEELDKDKISVATAKGVSVINLTTNEITSYSNDESDTTTLNGNFVMDFHKDKNGNAWVCTSSGLNLWNADNTFTSFTKSEGLPNDVIYGMESINNQIWVSSNKGITQITFDNPNDLKFRTFTVNDNVLNNEHNQFSHYQTKSGNFFFGGNNGFTFFNPTELNNNPIIAIPIIEKFSLFNEDASSLLDKDIAYTKQINLNHNQNFLSFDLSALSYFNAHQNQFQYKMEGLKNEWIDLGNRNYVSFNGLSPGSYKLLVKASNNDGVWNQEPLELKIHISQPIWNRWYAWLIYALIIASIVYYIYSIKINSIKKVALAKEEERNLIRERSARDFHDEAGTIITRLSLLAQFLRIQLGKDEKEITALQQLEDNIQRLRSGMRDFIWVLDPSKDSLESTIQKLNQMGNDLFEHSQITYSMLSNETNSKEIQLESIQRRQLVLIIKEGMNNILKHSKANKCELEISNDLKNCTILLKDDGIGIPENIENGGYGLKNLQARAAKINGKVSLKPNLKAGTILECKFPIHPNGL